MKRTCYDQKNLNEEINTVLVLLYFNVYFCNCLVTCYYILKLLFYYLFALKQFPSKTQQLQFVYILLRLVELLLYPTANHHCKMLHKFFHEYSIQKQRLIQDREVLQDDTAKWSELSKNEDAFRSRTLRTYLQQKLQTYNFNQDEFRKHLVAHQAIMPTIITNSNYGDFILVFGSVNDATAFA